MGGLARGVCLCASYGRAPCVANVFPPMVGPLEDDGDGDAISIEGESDGEKTVNLIELVNNEQSLQVTGKIRGVLKKLNKTYGGSVLRREDMVDTTKAKLEMFFENCAIAADKRDNYRVFVPYNT